MKELYHQLIYWEHPELYEILNITGKSKKIKYEKNKCITIRRMTKHLVWLNYTNTNKKNGFGKNYLFLMIPK